MHKLQAICWNWAMSFISLEILWFSVSWHTIALVVNVSHSNCLSLSLTAIFWAASRKRIAWLRFPLRWYMLARHIRHLYKSLSRWWRLQKYSWISQNVHVNMHFGFLYQTLNTYSAKVIARFRLSAHSLVSSRPSCTRPS